MKPLHPSCILVKMDQNFLEGGSFEAEKIRICERKIQRAGCCPGGKDRGQTCYLYGRSHHRGF